MTKLAAIDPGKATGIVTGYFDDDTPFQLEQAFVTQDGVDGFSAFNTNNDDPYNPTFLEGFGIVVYETFVLRQNGFLAALNGVEIIGYLKGVYGPLGGNSRLKPQSRTLKRHTPDATLKKYGFWQTGKMVNHKDGRDANDAIIHALTYLKLQGHIPTLKAYFPEELA